MNKHAVVIADQELARRHPALIDPKTGKLRRLTMVKKDEPLRKEWLLYYKSVDQSDKELTKHGFTTNKVGGVKVLCAPGKQWSQIDVLKILCKEEPWVVKILQHPLAKTKQIGRILYVDKKFKIDALGNPIGDPIDVRVFPGGGSNNAKNREINVLATESPEEVAATFVHEARHQVQPKGTWQDNEIDAYQVGEQYRIKRGLPEFRSGFRKPTGKVIPDPKTGKMIPEMVPDPVAIEKFVKKEYPVEPEWFPGEEIDEGVVDVSKGWDCAKVP